MLKNKLDSFMDFFNGERARICLYGLCAFCGLCRLMADAGWKDYFSWSALSVPCAIAILFFERSLIKLMEADGVRSRRIFRFAYVLGALFGICTDMGYQFQVNGMTAPGIKGKSLILITGFLLSFLFLPLTYRIFRFLGGLYGVSQKQAPDKKKCRTCFFMSLGIIQLCWFPVFLAYYPAIMSYDFHRQFGEAVKGYLFFYEYQPLVHTFLIRQAYLLGSNLGNVALGMAIFAFLQSLVLNAAISACITYVYKKTGFRAALFWLFLFALLPCHPILSLSITKDILFTSFFVFLLLLLNRMHEKPSFLIYFLFVLVGIVNILFRNNAVYALLFLIPAIMITERGKKLFTHALLVVFVLILGIGSKNLIRTTMHAIPGSEIEMYSVPIMQMVRVIKHQENNLTSEQAAILHTYISDYSWGDYYAPIADSAKSFVAMDREEAWTKNHAKLLKDYAQIGIAYPNEYIDAFLGLTLGYWFIDDKSHAEMLGFGDDTDLGLLYTFNASKNDAYPEGIESHSYLPALEKWYSHVVNGNSYYHWPILSQFMKPAFYFWLFVLVLFACLFKKSKDSILIMTYPFFYLMTMLLGPCVNFRYMYPFIIALPILIAYITSFSPADDKQALQETAAK